MTVRPAAPSGSAGEAPPDAWVVDLHANTLLDVARRRARGERRVLLTQHLHRLRAAHVRLLVVGVAVGSSAERPLERAVALVAGLYRELDESRDAISLVRTRAELRSAERHDRLGVILAVHGSEPLIADPANVLRLFAELGVRVVSLTRDGDSPVTSQVEDDHGLSRLGITVIRAMNDLGLVLDVSALPDAAFEMAVATAQGAVIASSAGARAIVDHPHNLTDAQIYAIGATGGLIGVPCDPARIGDGGIDAVARQIEYIAGLIGRDKVALGPDFTDYLHPDDAAAIGAPVADGAARPTLASLRTIEPALARLGFSAEAVRDVLGGNALRFFRKVLS